MASGNVLPKHFKDQDILFDLQHGFQDKKTCKIQLVMLVDELAKTCKYVLKRVSFGSKDCTKELKLECAYFLGQIKQTDLLFILMTVVFT